MALRPAPAVSLRACRLLEAMQVCECEAAYHLLAQQFLLLAKRMPLCSGEGGRVAAAWADG